MTVTHHFSIDWIKLNITVLKKNAKLLQHGIIIPHIFHSEMANLIIVLLMELKLNFKQNPYIDGDFSPIKELQNYFCE